MPRLLDGREGPPSSGIHPLARRSRRRRPGYPEQQRHVIPAEGRIPLAMGCLRRVVSFAPTLRRPTCISAKRRSGWGPQGGGGFLSARGGSSAGFSGPSLPSRPGSLPKWLARTAAEWYQRALALDPKRYEVYNDLGLVLTNLGNYGAAIECFPPLPPLNPRSAKTIAGLGYLFECKGDLISAADAYRDAIKLDPQLHAAYADLGFVLFGLGEVAEAADCFHRLRALRPDSAEATANLGIIHLLQGDLAAGWAEYESRLKVGIGDDRKLVQRRWKGEPLAGERILLYAEQGFGDTLQFVRYVPLVAARGGEVVLEVQPSLRRLLSGTDGASQVLSRGETLPEFTWQCSLLSLPLAFGTEMNTIPVRVPYVCPDPAPVQRRGNSASPGIRGASGWLGAGTPACSAIAFVPFPWSTLCR